MWHSSETDDDGDDDDDDDDCEGPRGKYYTECIVKAESLYTW